MTSSLEQLGERELAVAELMAHGHSQQFIAVELGWSRDTVRRVEHDLKLRIGAPNRRELVERLAVTLGLEIPARKMRCRQCGDSYPVSAFPNRGSNICETCRDRHLLPRLMALAEHGRKRHGRIMRYSQEEL